MKRRAIGARQKFHTFTSPFLSCASRLCRDSHNARSSRKPPPVPTVLQWNVNTLRPRHAELCTYLLQHVPDAVALQESYVRAGDGSGFTLPGYMGYHSPTACDSRQCLAVVYGDPSHPPGITICAQQRAARGAGYQCGDDCAGVAATLQLVLGGDVTVCSVYVCPNQPWDSGLLDRLVSLCAAQHLFCGDFNGHHTMCGDGRTDTWRTPVGHHAAPQPDYAEPR